ncbi:virB8 family protein [Limnohabitans radicicola]|uniref:Bacterial virulence protein VirB8 domain-containing protein n=1 Tax=Limnohabitans radicicola TaxID=2771427 RepID=A0A927ILU1_9BURK|nr:VirB8/TrbF family protein [Limnohabitans radicicola]MBD8051068.1 hypothetical protein [Limnohabitans radicicola]
MFGKKKSPQKAALPNVDGLSFEADLASRSYRSERLAWILVATLVVIMGMAVAAVLVMLPLKQTIPYYIFLNKESGATQAVVVNEPTSISTNEALARHWLSRYVSARERYVYRLQQEDVDFVMTTSAPLIAREVVQLYEGPTGKDKVLKETVEERISILSVQVTPGIMGRGTVRYQKITWRAGMREPESVKTYVADVAFEWIPVNGWGTKDLLMNPLGFSVVAYRTTEELEAR